MIQSNRGKPRKEGRPWEAGEIKGLFQGCARGAFILLSQFIKTDRIANYIKTSPRILLAGNFSRAVSTAPTDRCPISQVPSRPHQHEIKGLTSTDVRECLKLSELKKSLIARDAQHSALSTQHSGLHF